MKQKKNTIYTIAESLKLSPSTISKSLRDSHEISDEVKARVTKHCDSIGFRRRRFTPSRVNICAVVQRYNVRSRWLAGFVNEVIEGIADYVSERNVEFSIFGGTLDDLDSMDLPRELRRRHVDGVIFVNADKNAAYVDSCARQGLPFYCIQGDNGNYPERIIKLDNAAYTREAVRALNQMGHRRIALMASGPAMGASAERRNGFLEGMRDIVGLKQAPVVVEGHPEDFDPVAVGYNAGREILAMNERPSAVIIEGLKPPIGFIRACFEEKIRIPQDVSMLSLGNSSELEHLVPAVSTIDVPSRSLGELAAELLCGDLFQQASGTASKMTFPKPRVILRESTSSCS